MDTRIEALKSATLLDKDRGFAQSLVKQYEKKGDLSDKQWYWVEKLMLGETKPEAPKVDLGDCKAIYTMLLTARKHLKYPKITFMRDGVTVQLYLAGAKSKYAGKVMVTSAGRWEEREWFGVIDEKGIWTQTAKKAVPAMVHHLVMSLGADPVLAASEYGRLSGRCCFCNRLLEDERSTEVGYGPICAGHFGLPWGKSNKAAQVNALSQAAWEKRQMELTIGPTDEN
jgi:hypothetical protein